jgi:polyhydroxybutyrate depolymerase
MTNQNSDRGKKTRWGLLLALLFCLKPASSRSGEFIFEGVKRTYLVNVPSSYDGSKPVPLLLGLHGYSGTAERSRSGWGLDALSESKGFIVAYPNALAFPTYQMWNAGDLYDVWANHTNDTGFIAALIDTLVRAYRIDTARIFVTGHSNGSFMAYRVAAELSGIVAAVAPVAGQMVLRDCNPLRPVPIIHFHALDDASVPYNGANVSGMTVPPVEFVIALWAQKNGCSARADTVFKQNGIIGRQWSSPGHDGDVALYATPKGGHTWLTETNSGLAMNDVLWAFFEAHPMKKSGVQDVPAGQPDNPHLLDNYPNPCNPSTTIIYRVVQAGWVRITVLDAMGRSIQTMANGYCSAGRHLAKWKGTDQSGMSVGSGIYICRMEAEGSILSRKMLLVR